MFSCKLKLIFHYSLQVQVPMFHTNLKKKLSTLLAVRVMKEKTYASVKIVLLNTLISQQEISHSLLAVSFRVLSAFTLRSIVAPPSIATNMNEPESIFIFHFEGNILYIYYYCIFENQILDKRNWKIMIIFNRIVYIMILL